MTLIFLHVARLASLKISFLAPVLMWNSLSQWRTGDLSPFPEEALAGNISEISH